MQEVRHEDGSGLDAGFAKAQIPTIGEDDGALFVVDRKRILAHRMREMIQSGVDPRHHEEKADDEKAEGFEKSFHVGGFGKRTGEL
jgi:hypothetical protein